MSPPPDPATLDRPWLAAYPPGVPADYRIPEVALTRLLDDAARDFPDRPAVVAAGSTADYDALWGRVTAVAGVLAQQGVADGMRVIVALPGGHALPVALLALWRLGAVAVPVAPTEPADRLADVVAATSPGCAVATRRPLVALEEAGAVPPRAVLVTGEEWVEAGERRGLAGLRRSTWMLGRSVLQRRAATVAGAIVLAEALHEPPPQPQRDPPDPRVAALVVPPEADAATDPVVLTHANLVAAAFQTRLWIPDIQAGRERVLLADAPAPVVALTTGWLTALLSAGSVVLLDDPDTATFARTIERAAPTLLPTTSARLERLAAARDGARRDLTSLRVCLVSGPRPEERLTALLQRRTGGGRVRTAYGPPGTGIVTHAQPVYGRAEPDTLGLPLTGTLATVVDPADRTTEQPPGRPGLLAVRGPQVPARGWLVTDDRVVMAPDGVFVPVGGPGTLPGGASSEEGDPS